MADNKNKQCAIIDPVLNFDLFSATTKTYFADQIITYIEDQKWQCQWILETHAHADHINVGRFPLAENNGKQYFKLPTNMMGKQE